MSTVIIYGSSDDLIEVDGDKREEFYALGDENNFVCCSDGTVLQLVYDDEGMWRITIIHSGSAEIEVTLATDIDDDYSDRAVLTGDISWVVYENELDKALVHAGLAG
jgi:hypothetical protein